jgi:carbon monoxide dehydrogenase subunit G
MPSATFEHEVKISKPQNTIWDALQEPDTWTRIGPVQEVWDPQLNDDGVLIGYQWATSIGGKRYEGTATTVEYAVPSRYVLDLDGGEMGGLISTDIGDESDQGTDVCVNIELRSQGMMSSLFFPAIKKAVGSGFPGQVEDLAEYLER